MAKKKKAEAGGVPDWMVTYGDMMTLLLCFFVLLAAFSELKQDRYEEVLIAIKEAFGYTGGAGSVPTSELPMQSIIQKLQETALYKLKIRTRSQVDDPGTAGREMTVKKIREGLEFTIGGLITFEPGSAKLKPRAEEELARLVSIIRGKNNKIEIRGHATGGDIRPDSEYQNMWDLSYARASAVMMFFTSREQGIRPRRIRVGARADKEPLARRVYNQVDQGVNRRVEIIITETLVDEFTPKTTDQLLMSIASE